MLPREKKVKYHFSRIYVAIDLGHVRFFTVGSGSPEHLPTAILHHGAGAFRTICQRCGYRYRLPSHLRRMKVTGRMSWEIDVK